MTPVCTITANVADGANWKLSMCRTYWIRSRKTLVIGGLDYKVVSFVKNDYVIVSGLSQPVVTSFQLAAPIFRHGSSRKVNAEFGNKGDIRSEMVYLPRPVVEEDNRFDSDIAYVGRVKPLFLCDFDVKKDNTDDQQVDSIEPMNEMADVFFEIVEENDGFYNRPENIACEEWMNFGNPSIWGNDKLIFNQNLSGVERKFNLEVLPDGVCACEDKQLVTCAPVPFYLNDIFETEIESGDEFKVNLVDDQGDPVAGTFNPLTGEIEVAGGGGGSGGTINVYLDGVLNQSIVSSNLNAEIVNISI